MARMGIVEGIEINVLPLYLETVQKYKRCVELWRDEFVNPAKKKGIWYSTAVSSSSCALVDGQISRCLLKACRPNITRLTVW